jgi:hypothetical protein
MRVRQHRCLDRPAPPDLFLGRLGEGDHGIGPGDQGIELGGEILVVPAARIGQMVGGEQQRPAGFLHRLGGGDHLLRGGSGRQAVHVDHLHVAQVFGQPADVERGRRSRGRAGQHHGGAVYPVDSLGMAEVADIEPASGQGGHFDDVAALPLGGGAPTATGR